MDKPLQAACPGTTGRSKIGSFPIKVACFVSVFLLEKATLTASKRPIEREFLFSPFNFSARFQLWEQAISSKLGYSKIRGFGLVEVVSGF